MMNLKQKNITDYEKGLMNAVKDVFHNAEFNGCLFHFGQDIWRRINTSGLVKTYK
jgi:hypothetical protein